MKKGIGILLFAFVLLLLSGFVCKRKAFVPPGTVFFKGSLYIDKTEVRNLDWLEYVSWNKRIYGDTSRQYLASLPDTSVWNDQLVYNEPYVRYYFRHLAFGDYPVVGVSYEQALAYCKWRSDWVNYFLYIREHKISMSDRITEPIPERVRYRLPTEKEFEEIAAIAYSQKVLRKLNRKPRYRYNYLREKSIDSFNSDTSLSVTIASGSSDTLITAEVLSYYPNEIGVYNILGNVAEMVQEKGVAKGGGWKHTQEEGSLEKQQLYIKPENWIGFRCIAEVIL